MNCQSDDQTYRTDIKMVFARDQILTSYNGLFIPPIGTNTNIDT